MLDKANTSTFGNPEISKVNIGVGKNPGILISGHDLNDLEQLDELTAKGEKCDIDAIEKDIIERDHRDMTRETSPEAGG